MGADMDPQAKQAVFKKTRQDIAKIGGSKLLIKWADFIAFCQRHVDWYNNKEHSSLPIMVDAQTYKKRHYTPTEFWNKAVENGFAADRITSTARSSSIKAIFAKLSQPVAVQILPTVVGLDLTAVPVPHSKAKLRS